MVVSPLVNQLSQAVSDGDVSAAKALADLLVEQAETGKGRCVYLLTHGEYSDYSVDGIYEGPTGVDLKALTVEYLADRPEQAGDCNFDRQEFIEYLKARAGLTEVSSTQEFHLGSYSSPPGVD